MTQLSYQKHHDIIGVIAIEFISHTKLNCKSCYLEENQCNMTEKDIPNLCVLLLERSKEKERGIFDRYISSDDDLKLPEGSSFTPEVIDCDVRPTY